MNTDKYNSYSKLRQCERENEDYFVVMEKRESDVLIIAPHGGKIEPGTSEIAKEIAGEHFSVYCFEGNKPKNNRELHITSTNFDEPRAVDMVKTSQVVIAIHGSCHNEQIIYVGGLRNNLKHQIIKALAKVGFTAEAGQGHLAGRESKNICNRGITKEGLQLEISNGMRRAMFKDLSTQGRRTTKPLFNKFVNVVREVLVNHGK